MSIGTQLGAYRLLRRIGAGGMAEVFLAERVGEAGFARTVALKTILTYGAEEEAVQLFLDEARVAAQLNHPNIVQTVDLGYEHDTLFIVMEYVPGPSLSRIVRELNDCGRLMSPEAVAFVGAKVASALDYAWERATASDGRPLRMVHRDISPQNIMVTRSGLVKLSDFGIARASIQSHRTRTGQVRGKAAYMAPEQVRARKLDGRTDVFSLCLVLYEALTATRIYQRASDIESMRAIAADPVPSIRELNPKVPEALERAILTGLAKAPADRWPTADALRRALEEICAPVAGIEREVGKIVQTLFSQLETYDEHGAKHEAWQPTVADHVGLTPQPLGDAHISTKIAELLQTSPHGTVPSAVRSSTFGAHADIVIAEQPPVVSIARLLVLVAPLAVVVAVAVLWWVAPERPAPVQLAPAVGRVEARQNLGKRVESTPGGPVEARPTASAADVPVAPSNRAPSAPGVAGSNPDQVKVTHGVSVRSNSARTANASHPPNPSNRSSKSSAGAKRPRRLSQQSARSKPGATPQADGSDFQRRVLAARRAFNAQGDAKTAAQLSRLLFDLSMRAPTDADRRLLIDAEAQLRR